jgi:cytochrome c-type biogenesis protein CcmH
MMPSARLSGAARVAIVARVSRSGDASPRPGDLQGTSAPVASDASGVQVLVDTVVK